MRRERVGLTITTCSCSVFFFPRFSTPRVSVKSHAFFFCHEEGRPAKLLCERLMVITDFDFDFDFDLNDFVFPFDDVISV